MEILPSTAPITTGITRLPIKVGDGSPVEVDILILPGQTPDHFTEHAPAIAYNLDMTEVRVVPLGPSWIRLELFQ